MANFKYDKHFIENMAKEFMELLITHHCADAAMIYFNGERYGSVRKTINDEDTYKFVKQEVTFHPLQITEYTVKNNILSFSTEGYLYDMLYNGYPKWFEDFCDKYNIYAEAATSWFYHFCPNSEWDEWETDDYEVEEEIYLYRGSNELANLPCINAIAELWFQLSKDYGESGSFVGLAGFIFKYKGKKYKLSANSCSPYRRSLSWEHSKDLIHKCLEHIGCTDIHYDWGNMN